ncbi:FAD/NAD(P)-binding domain-containing protein [Amylostereum chailletii]|nr:FAD/NAD(P)-binding domain-containing protein [Amylostereum chailletii]
MLLAMAHAFRPTVLGSTFGSRMFSASSVRFGDKQRLVIVGSGWGGYETLRRVDRRRWDVTVISPSNHFNFTPLLASASVGTIEFRCAAESIRRYSPEARAATPSSTIDDPHIEEKRATPIAVSAAKAAPLKPGQRFTVPYDKLVIAVGAYSQTFGIPGVKEHAHFLKDVKDARIIRARIMECFEQANQPFITPVERRNLLHFCVVGGGPTGVEFSAELFDLIHTDLMRAFPYLAREARITLYDVAPQILGSFDAGLARYAEHKFRRQGIHIKTSHHVDKVEAGKLFVRQQGEVPFGLLVWSTGLAPNSLVQSIDGLMKDERKKRQVVIPGHGLLTDAYLNVLRPDGIPNPDVWAIGDAAQCDGAPLPATAQVAMQKAKYLSKQLNKMARGGSAVDEDAEPDPFEFKNQGALAYLGSMSAVYDRSQAASGPKRSGSGLFAWLLWRSAYVTRTVSMRNKILIPMYWYAVFVPWKFSSPMSDLGSVAGC